MAGIEILTILQRQLNTNFKVEPYSDNNSCQLQLWQLLQGQQQLRHCLLFSLKMSCVLA